MDPEAENGKAFLPSRCKTKVKLQEENKKIQPTNQTKKLTLELVYKIQIVGFQLAIQSLYSRDNFLVDFAAQLPLVADFHQYLLKLGCGILFFKNILDIWHPYKFYILFQVFLGKMNIATREALNFHYHHIDVLSIVASCSDRSQDTF